MSTAAQPLLPADIRLMNGVSALLLAGLVLAGLALALHQLARLPIFGIRHIQVEGDVTRNSVASLRANAMPHVSGTFLTLNLQQAGSAFQAVPWVRTAVVQRVWPNRLRVRLEEHRPAAYWEAKPEGADAQSEASVERALVNSFGEVFEANLGDVEDEDLPVLAGPDGSSAAMLAMWQQLNALSQKLGESARRLDLSGRGSWRLTLEKGAVVELGRGSEAEVLARFGQFAASITQISSRYQTAVLSADLRHHDGYAVRLQGISTSPGPATGAAKKR
ncbi:cell division protein FtsQ/DivIB [Roseateles cavernae]|uniref:cell division protein FtsQ/DivIB n=1 Tax=Roseateles cavernae TaxID=3153578 RepID=UPI0032E4BA36